MYYRLVFNCCIYLNILLKGNYNSVWSFIVNYIVYLNLMLYKRIFVEVYLNMWLCVVGF